MDEHFVCCCAVWMISGLVEVEEMRERHIFGLRNIDKLRDQIGYVQFIKEKKKK